MEQRRQATGQTLGIIRPARLLQLEIVPEKEPNWTEEEKISLSQSQMFDSEEVHSRPPLRKLPYRFYYRYECETPHGNKEHRHMITDWEVGALYWNCRRDYGNEWEHYIREKLERIFSQKDLMLLMGTMHRYPHQWLIIGLIYPPRSPALQLSLDLGG